MEIEKRRDATEKGALFPDRRHVSQASHSQFRTPQSPAASRGRQRAITRLYAGNQDTPVAAKLRRGEFRQVQRLRHVRAGVGVRIRLWVQELSPAGRPAGDNTLSSRTAGGARSKERRFQTQ